MTSKPTPERIETFVNTYAPILYLHPEESYLPTGVDWFLNKAGEPHGSGSEAYYEKLSPEDRRGDLDRARSYVHVKDPVGRHVEIQFWFFYAYNGPGTAELPGIDYLVNLAPFGEHGGDWEHATFRVDLETMKPTKVWLSQHDTGKLHDYGDLEQENGRPVLYASKNGHATYSSVGDHITKVVLRNVTGKGSRFDTSAHELLDVSPPAWLAFAGRWGPHIVYSGKALGQAVDKVHDRLSWILRHTIPASLIEETVVKTDQEDENGPTGPSHKSEWSQPETD